MWWDPAYEWRRDKISARYILGDIATIRPGDEVRIRFGKKNAKVWSGTYEGTVDKVEKAALASAEPSPSASLHSHTHTQGNGKEHF